MTTEIFTQQEFENVLTDAGFNWEYIGTSNGEEHYRVMANDRSGIKVQSSIRNGFAADTGDDSIRLWPQILQNDGRWANGKKADAWTTRQPGWQTRMIEKINSLLPKCEKIISEPGYCPQCHKARFANWSTSAKNPGRPFASCRNRQHDSFIWLDQPVTEKLPEMTDTQKKEVELNNPVDEPVEKGSFLQKGTQNPTPEATESVSNEILPKVDVKTYNPNKEQALAIFAPLNKALRVLAPPGSGKTWLLEQRIKYLVEQGVDPKNILYVTFSKDMADAGLARILATNPNLRGTQIEKQICTIHALCYRIYKAETQRTFQVPREWQLKKEITTLSEGDSYKKTRGIWEDNNKRPGWAEIYAWIMLAKANGLEGNSIQEFYHDLLGSYHGSRMTTMFTKLQVVLKRQNLITFPDMLYEVELMLRNEPHTLERYQNYFQHVIVDEGQDTSGQAMRILTALAKPQNQFTIVGDTDQMLYRFAGATPEANLYDGFEKRYPDAVTVKLVVNYRSTRNIVETCNKLIRYNYADQNGPYDQKYLKDVEARPDAPDGEPVTFQEYLSPEDEADHLVQEIKLRIETDQNVPGDFFVGTRTRAQLGYMEGYFIRSNVPFINIAGGSFWSMKHINDIIAYLRLAHNEEDKDAFARVYNISSNNMTVPWSNSDQYGQYCSHRFLGKAFLTACYGSYKYINKAWSEKKSFRPGIEDLREFIEEVQYELQAGGLADGLQFIVDYCYKKWLAFEEGLVNTDEAESGKLEDLNTVIAMSSQYDSIDDFLKFIDDAKKADEAKKDKDWSDYVVISTIHRLKGLERPVVFGCGFSEGFVENPDTGEQTPVGLLPHTFSLIDPPQNGILPTGGKGRIEDERDIAFVLVSRAKKECHLSGVQAYRSYNLHPSRFIVEMGLV